MAFHLPIISLQTKAGDLSQQQLASLRDACSSHGFFLLSNALEGSDEHLIEPAALKRIWAVAEDLFDAPLEAKRAVAVATSDNNRGYFSANDHREINKDPNGVCLADSKEGFFFGSDALIAPGNRVPEGKQRLLPEVEQYMRQARDVCVGVMRAIVRTGLLVNLPPGQQQDVAAFERAFLGDPVYMLKVLKYAAGGITDAHTDYGCITLLLPGDDGLQVHFNGQWNPVPVVPGTFVVNLGDLLQFWSSDAVKSTIHRVIFTGGGAAGAGPRYSIPFFLHPQRGSAISDGQTTIDSYEYVLDRFDKSYKHRMELASGAGGQQQQAAVSA